MNDIAEENVKQRRILVIEDSATMRAVCCDLMTKVGFECIQAGTAEEAWEYLENKENKAGFDAVLLDWVLPKITGNELLKRVTTEHRLKNLPVMIFSERPDERAWEIVLARPHTDIQLKDELQLLPQRMLKFIQVVEEKVVSPSIGILDNELSATREEETLLLVDDSATVRMRYSHLLREAGYDVIEADGSVEGLALARQYKPNLAILDFFMPDGNGDKLCEALLECKAADAVVMFSQRKDITEIALEVGALDLLYKDDPAHLFLMRINAIMQVIRSKRSNHQLELLVWSTQALGFGIMRPTADGLVPENPTMEMFQIEAGSLKVFDTEATFEEPLEVTYLSGEVHYFVVHRYPFSRQQEVVVAQDITIQKVAEKEIKEAKELAEKASKAKSDFLSNMTHELRSPLNAIIVLSRMLAEKNNDNMTSRQVESSNIIHRSGNELLALINDILDLAKVEAGMITIEVREFDFRNTLTRLVAQLEPLTEGKSIDLVWQCSDEIPQNIQTDELRLCQIIRNLVSNAVKFTETGKIVVDIELSSENTMQVSVTDTGVGIRPENLEKIFEAFQQEDNSTSRRFGGTGLGLSISRNMAKLLGGDINIESEVGLGSCFSVDVPINMAVATKDVALLPKEIATEKARLSFRTADERISQNETKSEASKVEKESPQIYDVDVATEKTTEAYSDLQHKTVLLVEDDVRNTFTLMTALESFDINFLVAQNGKEALEQLATENMPDIVLMDIMMPVMDGFEAIEKIRQTPEWETLPIIAVTANSAKEDEERCMKIGANGFVPKPVDIDLLVSKMSGIIH